MAISLATNADYLRRAAGLVDCKTGPATVMMWCKFNAPGAGYHTAWVQQDIATGLDYIWAGSGSATADIYESQSVGGVNTDTSHTAQTAATWFHVCIVRTGVSGTVWMVNGTVIGFNSKNMALATLDEELIGNDGASDGGVTFAYAREWDSALTTTQILDEMQSATPVHTANLWANWPFTSDINDDSGNGRNWTQFGSGTFVAGPTLPSNGLQSGAISLAGTATITPNFGDGFLVWYSYTPSANEDVLSVFAVSSTLTDTIETETFGAAMSAYPPSGSIVADNKPIQIPLTSTVYVRLYTATHLTGTPSLRTEQGPTSPAPLGTILINDDTANFPLAMLSPTTGLPLQFMNPFPNGEMVGVLNDGRVLLEDAANSRMVLLDTDLDATNTLSYPWGASLLGAMNSNRVDTFYASAFASAVAYRMSASPLAVTNTYTLAATISLLCPNRSNTILYYVSGGVNQAIRRWDLVNNIALSNLAAGVANHFAIKNLLVLSDDTILVGYGKSTVTKDFFVRHYSAAGATLGTYTLSDTTETINWMQLMNDTTSSVVLWSFPTVDKTSRFTYINGLTGAVTSTTPVVPIYEVGVYQPTATLTPDSYFGHSKSCPIWALAVTVTPAATSTEYLIRRERWFPVLSHEQFRQFFSKLQIDLQAGNGLTQGQGSDPLMEIDWSDDGGWTWSSIRFVESGRIGAYDWRPITRRLGYGRNRVFRIAVSDPVQWVVINGYLDAVLGTS